MTHNPPAFPRTIHQIELDVPGMTLRDYFAAGIASGLCSAADSAGGWTAPVHDDGAAIIAQRAYAVADALLAARQALSA